ncbi:MAG: DUF4179 domain-containing protein [Ruminococcus sp.]|jgi:hypothetical protein
MKDHNIIKILQDPVDIPPVVLEKADQAFEHIKAEALAIRPDKISGRKGSRKKIWLAAAVIAAVLGSVSVGAAVYNHWWSRGLSETLHASEEQMRQLDADSTSSQINQAVTDQGVTITAVQSIVDNYFAHISFKVEGYELPEGAEPGIENIEVTVDGDNKLNWSGGFYNGLVSGEDGMVEYGDGTPLAYAEDGSLIEKYVQEDGSLEYDLVLSHSQQEKGYLFGKTIHVKFSNLGTFEKTDFHLAMEGTWEFDWTLQGNDEMKADEWDIPLGDSGVVLKETEISPISMRAVLELPKGQYTMDETEEGMNPPMLKGVVMKDGTAYPYLYPGMGGSDYLPQGSDQYTTLFALDRILDVDQVESLLFAKESVSGENAPPEESSQNQSLEDRFYIVPLSES